MSRAVPKTPLSMALAGLLWIWACAPQLSVVSYDEGTDGGSGGDSDMDQDTDDTDSEPDTDDSDDDVDTGSETDDVDTDDPDTDDPDTDSGDTDTGDDEDCPDHLQYIYAIDYWTEELYRFDPESKKFTSLGVPDCGVGLRAEAISVARDGFAYVTYYWKEMCEGIFKVNLKTADCEDRTPFVCSGPMIDYYPFGMAFTADQPGTDQETLYLSGTFDGPFDNTLARVNLQTGNTQIIGEMDLDCAALTGDGQGQLWAVASDFDEEIPLIRVDRATAFTLVYFPLADQIFGPGPTYQILFWSLAGWAGDLYLFLTPMFEPTTQVYKITSNDDFQSHAEVIPYMADTGGRVIRSAGVSTCAPRRPRSQR